MSILGSGACPPKPDGEGWQHRIDDIPARRRLVEIVATDGKRYRAFTVRGQDRSFNGIGCGVGYALSASNVLSASTVAWWRYHQERVAG